MAGTTIYEFDYLCSYGEGTGSGGSAPVPKRVFEWLTERCLRLAADGDDQWLRVTQRHGRPAVQVTSFVGVIRTPFDFQIEVLPKVGKTIADVVEARQVLVDMLCCLRQFRHVRADAARLAAARMPLWEVFVAEFLQSVKSVVKRGLRSQYRGRRDNLQALRGKLLIGRQLQTNLCRADRFFTEHDEFSTDRAENRILHAALRRAIGLTSMSESQRLGRELLFVFADIPPSTDASLDFQKVLKERSIVYYQAALAWARLILEDRSPVTGRGRHDAPSLLFPMEAVFEAFVARHLTLQTRNPLKVHAQVRTHHLVRHRGRAGFRMRPDLVVRRATEDVMVLDTKWKLLDVRNKSRLEQYGLSQADFYQLKAYGHSYLNGQGHLALVYPKTEGFSDPLEPVEFPASDGLRLWLLPFCLKTRRLVVKEGPFLDCTGVSAC